MGKLSDVYEIIIQQGNHIAKSFQSKELKSNQGVLSQSKIGVRLC